MKQANLTLLKLISAATLSVAAGVVWASDLAAVESRNPQQAIAINAGQIPAGSPQQESEQQQLLSLELLQKVEQLQNEVQELRGMVETQEQEVKHLNSRQRDLFLDLDHRLAELQGKASGLAAVTNDPTTTQAPAPSVAENDQYQQAYRLMRERQYDKAGEVFKTMLETHPRGQYAANGHYWLGELNLIQGRLDLASQEFKQVAADFPQHQKAGDALLKLGILAANAGEQASAKGYFEKVQQFFPNSTSAQVAEQQLRQLLQEQ